MFSASPITFKKISEREIVLHVEKKMEVFRSKNNSHQSQRVENGFT